DNKFEPKSGATRGEVSAMLHRYIKLTITPDTAQGWTQNDAGQYFYYKDGKILTGWQTIEDVKYYFDIYGNMVSGKWLQIEGKWYYFNIDGSLAVSTTIEGFKVDEDGVRKSG
ncbi:MAG: Fibronectin type domain protein, partial [Eubacterium sp.]|nr:Fibronectin type domain protein [Eubacterium sp.]